MRTGRPRKYKTEEERRAAKNAWSRAHREKLRVWEAKYRETHREELRISSRENIKEWRANPANQEKLQAQKHRYYLKHRNGRRMPGGQCELCGKEETAFTRWETGNIRALQRDHDHLTGAERGLLCLDCNRGLGAFRDDSELMRRAARYVDSYKEVPDDGYSIAEDF
jgi:recombination endonuclease VII